MHRKKRDQSKLLKNISRLTKEEFQHIFKSTKSANRGQLDVPRATLSSCSVRAFAHAGPSLWVEHSARSSQELQSDSYNFHAPS